MNRPIAFAIAALLILAALTAIAKPKPACDVWAVEPGQAVEEGC